MLNEILLGEAQESAEEFVKVRRLIHSHAETGMELPHTVGIVWEKLKEYGYEPVTCGKSGIVALAHGKNTGRTILLRADMDALPMKEETDLDFASENGNMHACGHDMHTAMLLCAAKLLKMHERELSGMVKLMFQPAEEILSGARDMVENGVLEDPSVDAAFSLHVLSGLSIKSGTVIVPPVGVSAPGADYFEIKVSGKACHGSSPWEGVDALLAASHIAVALCEIPAREIAGNERAVITIGKMRSGSAANAIAGDAMLWGTVRAYSASAREKAKKRIAEVVNATAMAFRANAETVFGRGCPPLENNADMVRAVEKHSRELLGSSVISAEEAGIGVGGSEDFAYIAERVPSVMVSFSAGEGGYPIHHPRVTFDESVIPTGGALYAYNAVRLLEDIENFPLDGLKRPNS